MHQSGEGRPRGASQAMQQRTELELRINALNMQRGELSSQLGQLEGRRQQLQLQQAQTGPGAARAELQARIAELDARSKRLDQQIQGINDQVAAAMGELASVPPVPTTPRAVAPSISLPPSDNLLRARVMRDVGGILAMEAVLLAVVGMAFWRISMRRVREQFARAFGDQAAQLGQLQQAVDVIGVEVERISEGQRYVAKMLTEGSPAAAAPSFVARENAVRSPDV